MPADALPLPPLWPVSVKGVLVRDGQVLLVRNDRGEWELPGGRLEPEESLEACVVRELMEETGLEIACGPLVHVESFEAVPGRTVLIVAFSCHAAEPGEVRISEEHVEHAWFTAERLPGAELPDVYRRAIALAQGRP